MNEELELEQPSDDVYERRTFVIDKGQEPMRIDKWLQIRIEGATRNKLQQAIDNGFVTVNGKNIKTNYKVKPDDEILVLTYVNPEYSELKVENIPLDIVYEDADVLVINKVPNMVVHPGVGNHSGTLLNGVAYHLLQQNPTLSEDELPRYGMVHRIDKNTTGLIVLAKNAASSFSFSQAIF
jgi:23S rRNA pseudouridine1911/1915/1917 synthase